MLGVALVGHPQVLTQFAPKPEPPNTLSSLVALAEAGRLTLTPGPS